jgi:replicative DNA helicase
VKYNRFKDLNDHAFGELLKQITEEYERREIQEDSIEDQVYSHHIKHYSKEAMEIAQHPFAIKGIATGYNELDKYLCGLGPGELTTIAADTSVGKTLFTLNLLNNAYRISKKPFYTFYVSLDTAIVNVCARLYRMYNFDDEYPFYFYDNTLGTTFDKVKYAIKKQKEEIGLDIVVIDMLNSLVRSSINQATEMASVTLKLRELALELGVHIIILCHVTKETSKTSDSRLRPHYSSIKDSSAVAQDSDIVIMLGRDNLDKSIRNDLIVSVQKNRNKGGTGEVAMIIDWKTLNIYEAV